MMDSDEDDRAENPEADQQNSDVTASLTGFLFGNIDKRGKLEDDFLDEVRPHQFTPQW